jgi:hypothetical protein
MDTSNKTNRTTLKSYFVKNAIPTEDNFADLIESSINQVDDGIVKITGEPLSLKPDIGDSKFKKILNFYENFSENKPKWTLSLNSGGKQGLSFSDGDNTSKLFIDEATGNIGIGTTNPAAKLNISEETGTPHGPNSGTLILDHDNSGGASSIVFRSKVNRGSDYGYIQYQDTASVGGNGETARLIIGTSNDPNDHLILLPSGNVGIGTTEPKAPLSIAGNGKEDSPDDFMHITNDCILFGGKNSGKENSSAQISAGKHVENSLCIVGMSSGKSSSDRKVNVWAEGGLTVAGNAIIGDSGRTLKIGNMGHGNWAGVAHSNRANTTDYALLQESGGSTILNCKSDQILHFRQGNSDKMMIHNGNVGIGVSPVSDAKLYVNGTFALRDPSSGNYCKMWVDSRKLIFTLNSSTHGSGKGVSWDGDTNWDSYSDLELKTNIKTEKGILDRLLKLDVKNFQWKNSKGEDPKKIGFIAQDVQPLFPELVGSITDPETKKTNLSLKYANFGVLAVGAIKELKDGLITELENRIRQLEAKLAR